MYPYKQKLTLARMEGIISKTASIDSAVNRSAVSGMKGISP